MNFTVPPSYLMAHTIVRQKVYACTLPLSMVEIAKRKTGSAWPARFILALVMVRFDGARRLPHPHYWKLTPNLPSPLDAPTRKTSSPGAEALVVAVELTVTIPVLRRYSPPAGPLA